MQLLSIPWLCESQIIDLYATVCIFIDFEVRREEAGGVMEGTLKRQALESHPARRENRIAWRSSGALLWILQPRDALRVSQMVILKELSLTCMQLF